MIASLIVAALVVVVLGISLWALYEKNHDTKLSEAKAWAALFDVRQDRDLRVRELRVMQEDRDRQRARADWLLAQVYELRNMVPVERPHTSCFDLWVDGGQPCDPCSVMLGARNG